MRGTVVARGAGGEVLVEVGGVGYRVLVPTGALLALAPGADAHLHTHLHVRDDALVLYGFPTSDERATFEVLIGATGVGPKLALAMLSVFSPDALRRAVADDDLAALTLVPGVGKRTAQRLMIELKARLAVPDLDLTDDGSATSVRAEVRAALAGLGYGPDEVRDALTQISASDGTSDRMSEGGQGPSVEDLLRDALRLLGAPRVVANVPTAAE